MYAGLFVDARGDDSAALSPPYCVLLWCFDRERGAESRALWRFNADRPGIIFVVTVQYFCFIVVFGKSRCSFMGEVKPGPSTRCTVTV